MDCGLLCVYNEFNCGERCTMRVVYARLHEGYIQGKAHVVMFEERNY